MFRRQRGSNENFFHQQLEIDYSKAHLPQLYKEVVESCEMGRNEREVIVESLNQLQFGILFSCIPESDSGEKKLCANISVLHNLKALETIKNYLPQVYSEVSKRISLSRASSFYLLDSLRGFINEQ